MSERIYYKATRPDGTSFQSCEVSWAVGEVTKHPNIGTAKSRTDAADYLSVSDSPTNCTGFSWPCRLFIVEPVGTSKPWQPHPTDLPNKWAARRWRVVEEIPSHLALGPQGAQIAALVERAGMLTFAEGRRIRASRAAATGADWYWAWDAAWRAASAAARDASRGAAWYAAWDAAETVWYAARGAVWGLVVRDLISAEHYSALSRPWRDTIGRIHPDDED